MCIQITDPSLPRLLTEGGILGHAAKHALGADLADLRSHQRSSTQKHPRKNSLLGNRSGRVIDKRTCGRCVCMVLFALCRSSSANLARSVCCSKVQNFYVTAVLMCIKAQGQRTYTNGMEGTRTHEYRNQEAICSLSNPTAPVAACFQL